MTHVEHRANTRKISNLGIVILVSQSTLKLAEFRKISKKFFDTFGLVVNRSLVPQLSEKFYGIILGWSAQYFAGMVGVRALLGRFPKKDFDAELIPRRKMLLLKIVYLHLGRQKIGKNIPDTRLKMWDMKVVMWDICLATPLLRGTGDS